VIAVWASIAVITILLACIALAAGLAWLIGAVTSVIQQRRRPDFRERKRTGRGRSE
jgi:hypothetical protein